MTDRHCAVLVYDRKATAASGTLVVRECGSPAQFVLSIGGDAMFRMCHRHDSRVLGINGKVLRKDGAS